MKDLRKYQNPYLESYDYEAVYIHLAKYMYYAHPRAQSFLLSVKNVKTK